MSVFPRDSHDPFPDSIYADHFLFSSRRGHLTKSRLLAPASGPEERDAWGARTLPVAGPRPPSCPSLPSPAHAFIHFCLKAPTWCWSDTLSVPGNPLPLIQKDPCPQSASGRVTLICAKPPRLTSRNRDEKDELVFELFMSPAQNPAPVDQRAPHPGQLPPLPVTTPRLQDARTLCVLHRPPKDGRTWIRVVP